MLYIFFFFCKSRIAIYIYFAIMWLKHEQIEHHQISYHSIKRKLLDAALWRYFYLETLLLRGKPFSNTAPHTGSLLQYSLLHTHLVCKKHNTVTLCAYNIHAEKQCTLTPNTKGTSTLQTPFDVTKDTAGGKEGFRGGQTKSSLHISQTILLLL